MISFQDIVLKLCALSDIFKEYMIRLISILEPGVYNSVDLKKKYYGPVLGFVARTIVVTIFLVNLLVTVLKQMFVVRV